MKRLMFAVACAVAHIFALSASPEESLPTTPAAVPPPIPASTASSPGDTNQVMVEFHVYRVQGNITITAESLIWAASSAIGLDRGVSPSTQGDGALVFTSGDIEVAGVKLRADESGWTWDGKPSPTDTKKVVLLSSPKVVVLFGTAFEIFVGSEQPIQYFERLPDGRFELKTLSGKTGLRISGSVVPGQPGGLVLRDMTIQLLSVESRVPIEGVELDVGQPIIASRECKASIALSPGRDCGILLRTEGYGALIVRVRVTQVTSGEFGVETSPGPATAR